VLLDYPLSVSKVNQLGLKTACVYIDREKRFLKK